MINNEKIASIRNKLSPFWNLIELLSVDAEGEELDKILELTEKERLNCKKNMPIIEKLLKEIK